MLVVFIIVVTYYKGLIIGLVQLYSCNGSKECSFD